MSTTEHRSADTPDDAALTERLRRMWALGDYPRVCREIVSPLGEVLVDALQPTTGERVLDIAAGTGSAAVRAARHGADVVASDLTPELLEAGRACHPDDTLTWDVADAEALPYTDDEFDVVMSCIGVMFAPHHQRAADELLRVARPGARIGILSWTPDGTIGHLFATMRPYLPPPPPGVQPPPLWGSPDHLEELFGDRVTDLAVSRDSLPVTHFASGTEFRDYFAAHYGPTITGYRANADDPERTEQLDRDLAELGDREGTHSDDGSFEMQWEYLLVTATAA